MEHWPEVAGCQGEEGGEEWRVVVKAETCALCSYAQWSCWSWIVEGLHEDQ